MYRRRMGRERGVENRGGDGRANERKRKEVGEDRRKKDYGGGNREWGRYGGDEQRGDTREDMED